MAQTQFFTREENNLQEYKNNFNKALQKIIIVKLFPDEVIHFLKAWIAAQKNYIPREDIDNLGGHLERIFKNKDFYDFIVGELGTVQNSGKIQEYSFSLISQLDDSSKIFEKSEKERKSSEDLEKKKLESKRDDEQEMKRILEEL